MATGQPLENLDGWPRKWKQVGPTGLGIGNAPHGPREVDVCPAGRNEFAAACSEQEAQGEKGPPAPIGLAHQSLIESRDLFCGEEAFALLFVEQLDAAHRILFLEQAPEFCAVEHGSEQGVRVDWRRSARARDRWSGAG